MRHLRMPLPVLRLAVSIQTAKTGVVSSLFAGILCAQSSAHIHLKLSGFFDGDGGRGRLCYRPFSATVATIATVALAVSFSPLQPSQPSRSLFAFSIIGQRDTPPFVPNLVFIADVVFIKKSSRLYIQILAQYVCRHANIDSIGKFRG